MRVSLFLSFLNHYPLHAFLPLIINCLWLLGSYDASVFILLSVEQVITGLDRAVATMKKGERAIISIHPDYAFGNVEVKQDLAIVPPGSKVVYDIEMVDFIKVKGKKSSSLVLWGIGDLGFFIE